MMTRDNVPDPNEEQRAEAARIAQQGLKRLERDVRQQAQESGEEE